MGAYQIVETRVGGDAALVELVDVNAGGTGSADSILCDSVEDTRTGTTESLSLRTTVEAVFLESSEPS